MTFSSKALVTRSDALVPGSLLFLLANIATTSKALVPSSVALVPNSFFVTTSKAPVTTSVALVTSSNKVCYSCFFLNSWNFPDFHSWNPSKFRSSGLACLALAHETRVVHSAGDSKKSLVELLNTSS